MTKEAKSKSPASAVGCTADTGLKKSKAVEQLLIRDQGATLEELTSSTGWQPHSCRAFLTGLRKKGWRIERNKPDDGATTWHGNAPEAENA